MESPRSPLTVFLGEFEVVEARYPGTIALHMGHNVVISIHLGDVMHTVKPGDKLPLYTTIMTKARPNA